MDKYQSNKAKRQGLILEFINNQPKSTWNDINFMLKKHNLATSQSTISKDLDFLRFDLIDGNYQKREDDITKVKRELIELIFKSRSPKVRQQSNIHSVTVQCDLGMEGAVAGLLYDHFTRDITGIFPGLGCVLMLFSNEKVSKQIANTLQAYSQGKSKYVILASDEEIVEGMDEANPE